MVSKINGIPVYQATIEDEGDRMLRVSFVDYPAVESDFLAFSQAKPVQNYAIQDEEQRRVFGVVMRADYPMIRYTPTGEPFYIVFSRDTVRTMAEKYMAEGRANNVNLMHVDGSDVEGVTLCQYFIKDSAKGISPEGFEEISDGSLMAEYHVLNDEVWQGVKDGTFRGFSIEVCAGVTPDETSDVDELAAFVLSACTEAKFNSENMSKIKKILAALGEALKFGTMTTDKGVIRWEGDEAVKVGDEIEVVPSEEGAEPVKAEAGEYVGEELVVVVGEDGKVTEVNEKAAEPVAEEPAEEVVEELAEEEAPEAEAEQAVEEIAEAVAEEVAEEVAEDTVAAQLAAIEAKTAELEEKVAKLEEMLKAVAEGTAENEAAIEEFRKAPASKGAKEAYKAAEAPGSMAAAIKTFKARR